MRESADPWLASIIGRAMEQITYSNGELTHSAFTVLDYMTWVARKSFEQGRTTALQELLTAGEVAERLGVDRTTVFRRSVARGIGWRIGRDRLFTTEDVRRLGR